MVCSVPPWLTRSQTPLHVLFTTSLPGDLPDGEGTGTALVALGTRETQEITACISHGVGPGTVCDANKGKLTQSILPCGRHTIIAKVYQRPRWSDGPACIMLDDAETSIIATTAPQKEQHPLQGLSSAKRGRIPREEQCKEASCNANARQIANPGAIASISTR